MIVLYPNVLVLVTSHYLYYSVRVANSIAGGEEQMAIEILENPRNHQQK